MLPQLHRHGWMDEAIDAFREQVRRFILDYGIEAQKRRWLPKPASGEMLVGIAFTESGWPSVRRLRMYCGVWSMTASSA